MQARAGGAGDEGSQSSWLQNKPSLGEEWGGGRWRGAAAHFICWCPRGPSQGNNRVGGTGEGHWRGAGRNLGTMQSVRPVPPPPNLPCKLALRKRKSAEGHGSERGTSGGWGGPGQDWGPGEGSCEAVGKAVSRSHRKVFSWKIDPGLGSPRAVAGKEGPGATSREAGAWGASSRPQVLQSHPRHESREGGRAGGQAAGSAPAVVPVAAALADVSLVPPPPLHSVSLLFPSSGPSFPCRHCP